MAVTIDGTNGITNVNGSATTPAETGTDTDTGIYYGTNTVSLATGGTQRLTIDSSGNVGIGATPAASTPRLQVTSAFSAGSALSPYNGVYITSSDAQAADKGGVLSLGGLYDASSGPTRFAAIAGLKEDSTSGNYGGYMAFYTRTNGSATAERMRITSAGELLIGTTTDNGAYLLQVNSQIFATNATIATSDARLKENVAPITNALDTIGKVQAVAFDFKQGTEYNLDTARQTGFIAQDLQVALADEDYKDSIVKECGPYLGVAYEKMVPVLVAAIQELKAEFDAYKAAHP